MAEITPNGGLGVVLTTPLGPWQCPSHPFLGPWGWLLGAQEGGRNHHQTTIGGGFDYPLGSMGLAEPPLGVQGGGHGFFFYLNFFFSFFFFKKN
jgi:hypothetical protein